MDSKLNQPIGTGSELESDSDEGGPSPLNNISSLDEPYSTEEDDSELYGFLQEIPHSTADAVSPNDVQHFPSEQDSDVFAETQLSSPTTELTNSLPQLNIQPSASSFTTSGGAREGPGGAMAPPARVVWRKCL